MKEEPAMAHRFWIEVGRFLYWCQLHKVSASTLADGPRCDEGHVFCGPHQELREEPT
jgi:hypothetical protein